MSLTEAIQFGLKANLGILTSSVSEQEARAERKRSRSALLPQLDLVASENAAKVNLAAEGFSASAFGASSTAATAFPRTVGPFHYYDLHGALRQSLFDVTAIRNLRAESSATTAASFEAGQAREEVVLAVAGVYLELMADRALLDTQHAEIASAEATYRRAQAQADAGNKAPIEANRNLVELQTEQQRLRAQVGQVAKRQIELARLIGLQPGTILTPKEELLPLPADLPPLDEMISRAWAQKLDLRAAEARLRSAEEARKAASAERLPSVVLSGTYGLQGTNPNQGSTVFQASATLSMPIFEGGRIQADIARADAVVTQRRAEMGDLRSSIEASVRNAYIDLQVASDQLTLANSNRQLAAKTLQQSQDRFSVGVADSVEVVNSQQSLATADHDYVAGLLAQHASKVNLAHALGEAEKELSTILEKTSK